MKGLKWLLLLIVTFTFSTSFGLTANDTETDQVISVDIDVGVSDFQTVKAVTLEVANDIGADQSKPMATLYSGKENSLLISFPHYESDVIDKRPIRKMRYCNSITGNYLFNAYRRARDSL